jgi:hypothetical protein
MFNIILIIGDVHMLAVRQSRRTETQSMSKLIDLAKVRAPVVPLLGILGALVALFYPAGFAAFCAAKTLVV